MKRRSTAKRDYDNDFSESSDYDDYEIKRPYKKFISQCHEYITKSEVTLDKLVRLKATIADKSKLLQLYEIHKNTEPHTQEFLDNQTKLKDEYSKILNQKPEVKYLLDMYSDDNIEDKIIKLNTTSSNKSAMLKHYIDMKSYSKHSEEYPKMKMWLNCAMKLPFDNIKPFRKDPTVFLKHIRYLLDDRIFGLNEVKEKIMLFVATRVNNPNAKRSALALLGPPGVGKCLGKGERVIMYDGYLKNVENIVVGDVIMGANSEPQTVESVTSGYETMYKIIQKDGLTYTVNESHILSLYKKNYIENTLYPVDIALVDYLALPIEEQEIYYGYRPLVDFPTKIPLHLYPESIMRNYLSDQTCDIPENYIYNTLEIRFRMLQVIIDNSATNHILEIKPYQIVREDNYPHSRNFIHFLHSLGLKTIQPTPSLVIITPHSIFHNIFDIHVENIGRGEYFGFSLKGYHRKFLLSDFTVTHNTMISKSLSDILHFPFQQINMGGIQDVNHLKGHNFTYIGSQPGAITKAVSHMEYKNGIIFMDEFDKVMGNKDILSFMLHILDPIQNMEFSDNYLGGEITFDLSCMLFILSMNELPTDVALQDRLYTITIPGYTTDEKVQIVKQHILPKILQEHKLDMASVKLTKTDCKYIIENFTNNEPGIRSIEKVIYDIIQKLNLLSIVGKSQELSFSTKHDISFPITLNKHLIDTIL